MSLNPDFLAIDELNLDKECIGQPQLYLRYSMKLADARKDYDEFKSELDLTTATLNKQIRDKPTKFGLEDKITESAINAMVSVQPSYREACAAVSEAKHKVDVLQAVVAAIDQRKRMLVLLVDLRGQEMYSTPRVSGNGVKAVEEDVRRQVRKLGQRKTDDVETE